ncbi:hypothetical protein FQN51_006077 [Onygenales sp. PD_10]|nr:hypothetical protein FQN51_006077 [Onygenales sp. PD_10]
MTRQDVSPSLRLSVSRRDVTASSDAHKKKTRDRVSQPRHRQPEFSPPRPSLPPSLAAGTRVPAVLKSRYAAGSSVSTPNPGHGRFAGWRQLECILLLLSRPLPGVELFCSASQAHAGSSRAAIRVTGVTIRQGPAVRSLVSRYRAVF